MTSEGVRKDGEKDLKLYQCLEVKKTMQNKSKVSLNLNLN
jgi:hypothetical protein